MDNMGAIAQIETVIHASPEARLPVIEPPFLVDRDQHVVIEMARIGILGRPIFPERHRAENTPWSRSEKALSRHRRKRIDDRARSQPSGKAQFFRVAAPSLFDQIRHCVAPEDTVSQDLGLHSMHRCPAELSKQGTLTY